MTIDAIKTKQCPICRGSGKVSYTGIHDFKGWHLHHTTKRPDPVYIRYMDTCFNCNGTGQIPIDNH